MKKSITQINEHPTRKTTKNTDRGNLTTPGVPKLGELYFVELSFVLNMLTHACSLLKSELKI